MRVGDVADESTWVLVGLDAERQGAAEDNWMDVRDRIEWKLRRVVGVVKAFDMGIRHTSLTSKPKSRLRRWIDLGIVRVCCDPLPPFHPAGYTIQRFLTDKRAIGKVTDAVGSLSGAAGVRVLVKVLYSTHTLLTDTTTIHSCGPLMGDQPTPTLLKRPRERVPRSERAKAELAGKRTDLLDKASILTQTETRLAQLRRTALAFDGVDDPKIKIHARETRRQVEEAEGAAAVARVQYETLAEECEVLEAELREWNQTSRPVALALKVLYEYGKARHAAAVLGTCDRQEANARFKVLARQLHPDKTRTLPADMKHYTDEAFAIALAAKRSLCEVGVA